MQRFRERESQHSSTGRISSVPCIRAIIIASTPPAPLRAHTRLHVFDGETGREFRERKNYIKFKTQVKVCVRVCNECENVRDVGCGWCVRVYINSFLDGSARV